MKKIVTFFAIAAIMVGCSEGPALTSHKVRTLTLSENEKALCKRQNDFSIDMLKTMCEKETGNVFISPLSAAFVCAMTANGAQGATQEEILKAIGAEGYDLSELNEHYLNLMENLPYQDATSFVGIANAAWVDKDYLIENDFAETVRTHYLATVDNIELSDPASANIINSWAKKQTKGMVKEICNENYFSDDLHLVLANALCFKGKWDEQFKSTNTREQTFHAITGDIKVRMMNAELEDCYCTGNYLYDWENDKEIEQGARVLRMYYKGKGYCMDVILPDQDETLDEWLPTLTTDWVDEMLKHAASGVNVSFPKFKLTCRYRLNEPMQAMGMKRVFGSSEADLSGITKESQLYLALLQQDTFIEVDEEGTRAAAVTSGWFTDYMPAPKTPFIADRPFVFFIRDVKNGIILFAGRITNPNA